MSKGLLVLWTACPRFNQGTEDAWPRATLTAHATVACLVPYGGALCTLGGMNNYGKWSLGDLMQCPPEATPSAYILTLLTSLPRKCSKREYSLPNKLLGAPCAYAS
jgi:hypothetical protein